MKPVSDGPGGEVGVDLEQLIEQIIRLRLADQALLVNLFLSLGLQAEGLIGERLDSPELAQDLVTRRAHFVFVAGRCFLGVVP
ncbi:MAG: hypothetical protein ABFD16_20800 [Thermoguttaceae bacterium]